MAKFDTKTNYHIKGAGLIAHPHSFKDVLAKSQNHYKVEIAYGTTRLGFFRRYGDVCVLSVRQDNYGEVFYDYLVYPNLTLSLITLHNSNFGLAYELGWPFWTLDDPMYRCRKM